MMAVGILTIGIAPVALCAGEISPAADTANSRNHIQQQGKQPTEQERPIARVIFQEKENRRLGDGAFTAV